MGSSRRVKRFGMLTILLIATLLVVARLYLPHFLKWHVNKTLDRLPDYQGHVESIDVELYRGAYRIEQFVLRKRDNSNKQDFLSSQFIDLSVEWRALLRGKLVGEVEMERPELNLILRKSVGDSQITLKKEWTDVVQDLFPIDINRFEVTKGELTYRHEGDKQPISFSVSNVNGVASELSNRKTEQSELPSTIQATGLLQKSGVCSFSARFNALTRPARFSGSFEMKDLALPQVNTFLEQLAGVDAESGKLDIFARADSRQKGFRGYLKPIARQVKLLSLKNDQDSPLDLVWQSLVAAVAEVFTNQRHDQFATEIEFSGDYREPESDIWSAVTSILENAFIKALPRGLNKE